MGYDVHYLIVGDGDDRGRLEALARMTAVSDRVHFLGPIGLTDLIETYRAADLFVLPSTGEGFGIAYLEAMASGTGALGFGVAGAIDALGDGELGAITSELELVTTIAFLLDQERPVPGELSRSVRTRFGRESFLASTRKLFDRLAESV